MLAFVRHSLTIVTIVALMLVLIIEFAGTHLPIIHWIDFWIAINSAPTLINVGCLNAENSIRTETLVATIVVGGTIRARFTFFVGVVHEEGLVVVRVIHVRRIHEIATDLVKSWISTVIILTAELEYLLGGQKKSESAITRDTGFGIKIVLTCSIYHFLDQNFWLEGGHLIYYVTIMEIRWIILLIIVREGYVMTHLRNPECKVETCRTIW